MSNKKKGEDPFGRMGKVSCALIISTGLVGPKICPNWTKSIGQKVNILLLNIFEVILKWKVKIMGRRSLEKIK